MAKAKRRCVTAVAHLTAQSACAAWPQHCTMVLRVLTAAQFLCRYCFNTVAARLDQYMDTGAGKGAIGLHNHPHRNLVATWGDEGLVKVWKA